MVQGTPPAPDNVKLLCIYCALKTLSGPGEWRVIVIYRTLALETYDMLKKKFNIADRIRYRKELATFKKLAIEYSKEPVFMLQVITRLIAVFMYDGGVKSEK